jgi:hypothetical protein
MLHEFCRQQETDILRVHEVTHKEFAASSGYTAHVNIGKDWRGSAILMRQPLTLERTDVLPSGRGLAGYCKDTYTANIYSRSSAARRAGERNSTTSNFLIYSGLCRNITFWEAASTVYCDGVTAQEKLTSAKVWRHL